MEILEHGVLGCTDPQCGLMMTRVKPGDHVIIFVSGYGCRTYCKSFTAELEVVSEWRRASGRPGGWSSIAEVKPINLGKVELGSVASRLTFVRGRKSVTEALHSVDPTNPRATPMPMTDAQLIINELRRQTTPRPITEAMEEAKTTEIKAREETATDEEVVRRLTEIAEILNYYPVNNYDTGTYKITQLWWESQEEYNEGLAPLAAFETNKNTEQTLAKLKHAKDKWRGIKLYIITNNKEEEKQIQKALKGSFHELKNKIKTITKQEINQLHEDLKKHQETLKELTKLRQE